MFADSRMFERVESILQGNGSFQRFEDENGPIRGRMMITQTEIPKNVEVMARDGAAPIAFEASFDFYESTVGLAIYTADRQLATGLWTTPQRDGAEPPADDWVEFFIKTLVGSIEEDGSFGVPIYSLVNDTAELTVVPRRPD